MKAPHKEALLKALEQIIEVATASIAVEAGPLPHAEQVVTVLLAGHAKILRLARAARGDRRWGRRPSLTPLSPKDDA